MSCEWCKNPVATVTCPKCNLLHACSLQCLSSMAAEHSRSCQANKPLPQMNQQNDIPIFNIGTEDFSIHSLPAERFKSDTIMLECPICLEVPPLGRLQEHTTCDTLYCAQCLSHLQDQMLNCVCGDRLTSTTCRVANRHIRGIHSLLKISCRFSPNCQAVCTLEGLAGHEKHCNFGEISCSQCQAVVIRNNYIDHRNNLCPGRLIKCEKCNHHVRAVDKDKHLSETCGGVQVKCQYCKEGYRRDMIRLHQVLKCENKPWQCRLLGCSMIVRRKSLTEHERTCEYGSTECKFCHESLVKRELSRHQSNSCPNTSVKCSHAGCDKLVLRKNKAQHEKECEFRPNECSHCGQLHKYRDQKEHIEMICEKVPTSCSVKGCNDIHPKFKISEHERKCPYRFVKCDDCSHSYMARNEDKHEKNCPMIRVQCPVPNCGHSCPRKNLKQHYHEEGSNHIHDLLQIIRKKENDIEKLQRKTQSLESQLKVKKAASSGTKVSRNAQNRFSRTKKSEYDSNSCRRETGVVMLSQGAPSAYDSDDWEGMTVWDKVGEVDDAGSRGTSPTGMFAQDNLSCMYHT